MMQTSSDLKALLARIDRRGYPAYKDTKGAYRFADYVLSIDHVQGDPFASPSRLSIRVEGKTAAFPPDAPGIGIVCLCGGREHPAPGLRGLGSAYEGRCGIPVAERTGGDAGTAPSGKTHRHGRQKGNPCDRGRRLSWKIHPAQGPGAGRL